MNLEFNEENHVKGNHIGKKLYSVVTIDQDDSEDTSVDFFRANDYDDLYDHVKLEFIGDEDENEEFHKELCEKFDDDWGFIILYKEIATITE